MKPLVFARLFAPLLLTLGCSDDQPQPWSVNVQAPATVRDTVIAVVPPANTVVTERGQGSAVYWFGGEPRTLQVVRHGGEGALTAELWHEGELLKAASSAKPGAIISMQGGSAQPAPEKGTGSI